MQGATFKGSTEPFLTHGHKAAPGLDRQPATGGLGTVRTYEREQPIYVEGQGASHFYEVQSGAVRVATLQRDGQRQIVSFAFAGDVFGLEPGSYHRLGAEALMPSTLIVYRRSSVSGETPGARYLAGKVATATTLAFERLQDHVILLGRRSAFERIAAFLCRMSDRLGADTFELPMSRSDVADHLGLTVESISRTLTSLAHEGMIEAPHGKRTISITKKNLLACAAFTLRPKAASSNTKLQ